jgi:hypothetical protein
MYVSLFAVVLTELLYHVHASQYTLIYTFIQKQLRHHRNKRWSFLRIGPYR